MTEEERKELANEVEERLDDELDFELYYEIDDYDEQGCSIVDVDINIEDCDYPDDWDKQVEDVIASIVNDWGGYYSWDGWCISITIPDDE